MYTVTPPCRPSPQHEDRSSADTQFGVGFIISMAVQPISFGNIMLEMFHSKIYIICLLGESDSGRMQAWRNADSRSRLELPLHPAQGDVGWIERSYGRRYNGEWPFLLHPPSEWQRENTFALRDRSQQRTMNPLDAIHVATIVQRSVSEFTSGCLTLRNQQSEPSHTRSRRTRRALTDDTPTTSRADQTRPNLSTATLAPSC